MAMYADPGSWPCAPRRLRASDVVVEPAPLTEAPAAVTAAIADLS